MDDTEPAFRWHGGPLDGGAWDVDDTPVPLADVATPDRVSEHAARTLECAAAVAALAELAGDGPVSSTLRGAVRAAARNLDEMARQVSDVMASGWTDAARAAHAAWPDLAAARAALPDWAHPADDADDDAPSRWMPDPDAAAAGPPDQGPGEAAPSSGPARRPRRAATTRKSSSRSALAARRARALAAAGPDEVAEVRRQITNPVEHARIDPIAVPRDSYDAATAAAVLEDRFHHGNPLWLRALDPSRDDVDPHVATRVLAAAHPTLWERADAAVIAAGDDADLAAAGAFDAIAELDVVMPYLHSTVGYLCWQVGQFAMYGHLHALNAIDVDRTGMLAVHRAAMSRVAAAVGPEGAPAWVDVHPPGTLPPLGSMPHEATIARPDGGYDREQPFWWPRPAVFPLLASALRALLIPVEPGDVQHDPARRRWRFVDDPTRDGGHHPSPALGASHIASVVSTGVVVAVAHASTRLGGDVAALARDPHAHAAVADLARAAAARRVGRESPSWRLADDEVDELAADVLLDRHGDPAPDDDATPEDEPGLGDRLRQARKAEGLTQSDVAGLLSVSTGAVSSWENGRARPAPTHRRALADLFPTLDDDHATT